MLAKKWLIVPVIDICIFAKPKKLKHSSRYYLRYDVISNPHSQIINELNQRNETFFNAEIANFERTFSQYAHNTLFYQSLTKEIPDYVSLQENCENLSKNGVLMMSLPVFWKIRLRYIFIKLSKAFPEWTKQEG
jgi:hypothetical protein